MNVAASHPTFVTLDVEGMHCGSCVGRVERAIEGKKGVVSVAANLAANTVAIGYIQDLITPIDLAKDVTEAGYPSKLRDTVDRAERTQRQTDETNTLARRVIVAAALTLPIFILEMGAHIFPAFHHFIAGTIGLETSWAIQFVLATAVLFWCGSSFYTKGFPALFKGAPDMNSLVALGTSAAWGYSAVALFLPRLLPTGTAAVYFEAAAMIVVLILLGRWLEARARGLTGSAIASLLGLQSTKATILKDGQQVDVDADTLSVGDTILVRPGERIPTDGDIIEGTSHVDESMITGEPTPSAKTVGASLTGGTINGAGSLKFKATRIGADTTLSQIIRMVEDAQGAKLPVQDLVNRITLWFVPAILAIALLTLTIWLIFGPDLSLALVAAVSVLIVACPCAMGLATPTSIMVGTGRAAEMGVLFRKGDALQTLSDVDVIAFDKTGTVTVGKPEVTDFDVIKDRAPEDLLALIAAVEARSEHPIALALVRAAQKEGTSLADCTEFEAIPGFGVTGTVKGHKIHIGAKRYMDQLNLDLSSFETPDRTEASIIYAAIDGKEAARITISDLIKPNSQRAIQALKDQGFEIALITGDGQGAATAIAAEAGIHHVVWDVLPDGKVAALDDLRKRDRKVAFVGDGMNDAPALAHADVGIAIGTGTDVAIETADVIIMSGDLRGLVSAVDVSQKTMSNIRQNLVWAFGYNVALIPMAAGLFYPAFGILLSPVFAAAAMALSSVSVVLNALRLRRTGSVAAE